MNPFSNSDEKLWDIIFKSFSINSNVIILSHIPLSKNFSLKEGDLSINIVEARDKFYNWMQNTIILTVHNKECSITKILKSILGYWRNKKGILNNPWKCLNMFKDI